MEGAKSVNNTKTQAARQEPALPQDAQHVLETNKLLLPVVIGQLTEAIDRATAARKRLNSPEEGTRAEGMKKLQREFSLRIKYCKEIVQLAAKPSNAPLSCIHMAKMLLIFGSNKASDLRKTELTLSVIFLNLSRHPSQAPLLIHQYVAWYLKQASMLAQHVLTNDVTVLSAAYAQMQEAADKMWYTAHITAQNTSDANRFPPSPLTKDVEDHWKCANSFIQAAIRFDCFHPQPSQVVVLQNIHDNLEAVPSKPLLTRLTPILSLLALETAKHPERARDSADECLRWAIRVMTDALKQLGCGPTTNCPQSVPVTRPIATPIRTESQYPPTAASNRRNAANQDSGNSVIPVTTQHQRTGSSSATHRNAFKDLTMNQVDQLHKLAASRESNPTGGTSSCGTVVPNRASSSTKIEAEAIPMITSQFSASTAAIPNNERLSDTTLPLRHQPPSHYRCVDCQCLFEKRETSDHYCTPGSRSSS